MACTTANGLPTLRSAVILSVAHFFFELHSTAARDDTQLDQFIVWTRAVPMFDSSRRVIDLPLFQFLHRFASPLNTAHALLDEKDEAAAMTVPVGPRSGREFAPLGNRAF